MTLYEITGTAINLLNLLQSEEIDEQTYNDTLESLNATEKVENMCKIIRNLEAETEAYKKEKERMALKQKHCENAIKRLKESLLNYFNMTNTDKLQTGVFKLSVGKSEKIIVNDIDKIPDEFLTYVPAKVNLIEVKKCLKAGMKIEGVEVEKNNYIKIM